jgi:hypothetical protein
MDPQGRALPVVDLEALPPVPVPEREHRDTELFEDTELVQLAMELGEAGLDLGTGV